MSKKKSFYICVLILGLCAVAAGFALDLLKGEDAKSLTGACLGAGAGLSAMSLVNLIMKLTEKRNPETRKRNEIELNDERNTLIRCRAKAKAADFTQWLVIGIAYVTIIAESPLWLTLIVVGVYTIHGALTLFYMGKYQNEI